MPSVSFKLRRSPVLMLDLLCLICASVAHGGDLFDGTYLAIPSVLVGNMIYPNVKITVGNIIGITGGTPSGSYDTYNPSTNQLTIPSVQVGQTFNNVEISVGNIMGVAGGTPSASYDLYNPITNQLTIPTVQVGSTTYNNVTITVGNVIGVAGGTPSSNYDTYNPSNNHLTIPSVLSVSAAYTNVKITVGNVISAGGPVTQFSFYKRYGTTTPQTATLGSDGLLNIDGKTIPGISTVTGLAGTTCLAGGIGTTITDCWSPPFLPQTMLICGPDPVSGTPHTLLYVLFNSPDSQNVASSATALLNALQSQTNYLGIGVYNDCTGVMHTSWIRNYPNTNYYLWPNVFTTYSSAYVSGLLTGSVINATPTAGNNPNQYAVVRINQAAGVFELWH